MTPLVSTIEIDLPPQEVFAFATDPTRFSQWQHDVVTARFDAPGVPAPGSRFTTTRWIGRSQRTFTQEIVEIEPPRRWSARGVDGLIRPDASITVEALDDGERSRVQFGLDFRTQGIGLALLPLVRRQAEKLAPNSYHNLKNLLEAGRARQE